MGDALQLWIHCVTEWGPDYESPERRSSGKLALARLVGLARDLRNVSPKNLEHCSPSAELHSRSGSDGLGS